MPQNKNALTRYALLDRLLSNHRKAYSIQDLTDYLAKELPNYGQEPVTRRCVEKDILYLEFDSPFDVEFERYKVASPNKSGDGFYQKPCIRYADPSFSIFKKPLSEDERSLLASVLSALGSFKGQPNFEWLDALAQKMHVDQHQEVISMSKNINENSTLLAELFAAISSKAAITIHYHTFTSEEIKTVPLSPYLLKEYNCRWYLLAGPFDSDRVLSFALDRINGFEYAKELTFKPVKDDLTERYEDIIGITYYDDKPVEEIVFWISEASAPYIITKPIHGSMRHLKGSKADILKAKYPSLPPGEFFSIECIENYELIRELTTYGANLIVLAPSHIVEQVASIAAQMNERYRLLTAKNEFGHPS
ncbi:MAG: WYL domain-containing protein [Muribaculaceae bacterium]|nr:WYL domain-containing protein [Muribaculaceae bacterium]